MRIRGLISATLISLVFVSAAPLSAQTGAKSGEWRTYGGDLGNTHYSPLEQINADNFYKLQVAWRFKTDNLGPAPEFNLVEVVRKNERQKKELAERKSKISERQNGRHAEMVTGRGT